MKRILSRRAFLQGSAAAARAAWLVAKTIRLEAQPLRRAVAPSDRVRFGMIGIGMQGSGSAGPGHHDSRRGVRGRRRLVRRPPHAGQGRSRRIPACRPRGNIRSCWTARTSTASWRRFRITGIGGLWSTPATRARISIARSRCRTPLPTAWRWSRPRRRTIASCRLARSV